MSKPNIIRKVASVLRNKGISGLWKTVRATLMTPPTIDITNDYLGFLSFANAGMLERGNIHCIDLALRDLPDDSPILEIGSFCGLSTNVITYLKARHGIENRLITCDAWNFEGADADGRVGDSKIPSRDYKAFVKESFMRNARFFSGDDLPFTIETNSDGFFELWKSESLARDVFDREIRLGGPLSFCYIDGNHTYEFCLRDFMNCDRYLVPGGYILFDDSNILAEFGVRKVVSHALDQNGYSVVAVNPNYLIRKPA